MAEGSRRAAGKNRPFFMYLSFRAPHRPMSHDWEFDPKENDRIFYLINHVENEQNCINKNKLLNNKVARKKHF